MIRFKRADYLFRFHLGDFTAFSKRIPVQQATIQLVDDVSAIDKAEPPEVELEEGSEGFLARCMPTQSLLEPIVNVRGFIGYAPYQYLHCYIDLQQSFDDYSSKFSSKSRATIRRKIKKFAERGGGQLDIKSYKAPDDLKEFFEHALAVSSKTYQEKLLDAGLPDSSQFKQEAHRLAEEDRLRAYILFDGARPVSYLYCPVHNDILYYDYLGYDPEYRKLSVGTVLQWIALEEIFNEQKFKYFDFTEGDSDYKRQFSTHQQMSADILFLRQTFKNKLLVYSHHAFNSGSEFIGQKLDQFGLKSKVKKLLRQGAG